LFIGVVLGTFVGTLVITNADGGASYDRFREIWPTAPLTCITFTADGNSGWAVGWSGTIIRTTDQGSTWKAVDRKVTGERLKSIAFEPKGKIGCAVGTNGVILWSEDSGKTWELTPSVVQDANLETVMFEPSHNRWWVVG